MGETSCLQTVLHRVCRMEFNRPIRDFVANVKAERQSEISFVEVKLVV
jgi:hypothetical protein